MLLHQPKAVGKHPAQLFEILDISVHGNARAHEAVEMAEVIQAMAVIGMGVGHQ